MNDYYKIPTGYSCISIVDDSSFFAYKNNQRDTYRLNGFKWQKVGQTTYNNSYYYNCDHNYNGSHFVPSSHAAAMIMPATLIVLCVFSLILKFFRGIHGHV